jgi:transcriptional regulator with XRE-family HTH domain
MPLTPLRRARQDAERTQFSLAVEADVAAGRLSMFERGLLDPTRDEQRRLAAALGKTVEQLFPGCGDVASAAGSDV